MTPDRARPQYFFDDSLIRHQQRLVRRWFPATVYPWPAVVPDRPWETRMLVLFGTVIPLPDGRYRLYYGDFFGGPRPAGAPPFKLLVAESDDGFRWQKPDLGLVEHRGSNANNIMLIPDESDGGSIAVDPDDRSAPYKMITFEHVPEGSDFWNARTGLFAYDSPDGLRWRKHPRPVLKAGDRTNVMGRRVNGRFVVFTRHPDMMRDIGARAIYRSESEDFLHWSPPELILAPDLGDEPDTEFYGMSAFEHNGWHFGLLEHWRRDLDVLTTHLVVSRDGIHWQRTARAPFIGPTCDWNRTWSSCASNGPIFIGDQMVFYFGGRWTAHSYDAAQKYGAVGYASLAIDRFCAIEATTGGLLETVPMTWPGGDLAVNADTRESFTSHAAHADGHLDVEVMDPDGRPLDAWSGAQKAVFSGNTHCRGAVAAGTVRWPGDRSLDALRGRTLCLRFTLVHARLYTFRAAPRE